MKIVLIEVVPEKRSLTMELVPQLGLGYIASVLESKGHKVAIIDGVSYGDSLQLASEMVVKESPDAIGFTSTSQARLRAMELISRTKKTTGALTVAGGPHFNPTGFEALKNINGLDAVIKGEGEYTMLELVEAYAQQRSFEGIKGIFFRKDSEIIETVGKAPIMDLNEIPEPAYHLFNLKKYVSRLEGTRLPVIGVISSRGCPNNCIFCANRVLGKGVLRLRQPKSFVNEIEFLKNNYGYRAFDFWDDTLTMSRCHIENICDEILKRGLKIKWFARARVNTVDRDLLGLMKRAGCITIAYGVESGSERTLAAIHKNITVSQSEEAVRISAELGFIVSAYFIVSLPGETIKDIDLTAELIYKFKKYPNVHTYYCFSIIYPGTELEQLAKLNGVLPNDFSWYKPFTFKKNKIVGNDPALPCYEDKRLSMQEIKARMIKSDPLVFTFKKIIKKIFKIRSFSEVKDMAYFYLRHLFHQLNGKKE